MIQIFDIGGVILATVAAYLVGWAWYSKVLWQKPWMEAIGHTNDNAPKNAREFARVMVYGFLSTFAVALGVKTLLLLFVPDTLMTALELVLVMVFTFGVTTKFMEMIYESKEPNWSKKPQMLFLIGSGHLIVSALVITTVLWYY